MASYEVTWITDHLAVGHAPMSYDELESIQEQGIGAIVNLCGEYCDLHQIEKDYGFEVLYFPVQDDRAPRLEEMEKALDWLDEAIYLGKRVLVHCRLGIGRTGTFVTSYLLRRGFGLKLAKQELKKIRSNPTSFAQWRLLRKYGKKAGKLTIREPSLEGSGLVDLSPYFGEYESILQESEAAFGRAASRLPGLESCGRDTDNCCTRFLNLQFIEAAYLSHHLNRKLTREDRQAAIQRAVAAGRTVLNPMPVDPGSDAERSLQSDVTKVRGESLQGAEEGGYRCPLSVDRECIAYSHRPLSCRCYGVPVVFEGKVFLWGKAHGGGIEPAELFPLDLAKRTLYEISRRLFYALNGAFLEGRSLLFPLTHVVSGRFVQDYFGILVGMDRAEA